MFSFLIDKSYTISIKEIYSFLLNFTEPCTPSPLPQKEIETLWGEAKDYVLRHKNNSKQKDLNIESSGIQKQYNSIELQTKEILKKYHFITLEETKEIYYYKDGVYIPRGDIIIEKVAEKLFGYLIENKDLSEIKGHIMRKSFVKRTELDKDPNIINLKNGILHR